MENSKILLGRAISALSENGIAGLLAGAQYWHIIIVID